MKNLFQHYTNDNYLSHVNEKFIVHDPGFRKTGYIKPENKNYSGSLHTFIVDWQIPKDDVKFNT